MAVRDQIAAVLAGQGAPEAKRLEIAQIRASACFAERGAAGLRHFTAGSLQIQVRSMVQVANDTGVELGLEVRRNGQLLRSPSDPWTIINPPAINAETGIEAPAEALRVVLTELLLERYGG